MSDDTGPASPSPSSGRQAVGGSTPVGPYSAGVIADGPLLFVSGQIAARDGEFAGGTLAEQTNLVLDNLEGVLAEAGATLDDVVRCGVFLSDLSDGPAFNEIYASRFAEPRPARATVEAKLPLGALVEVECVAALRRG